MSQSRHVKEKNASWLTGANECVASWQTIDIVAFLTLFVLLLVGHTVAYQLMAVACIVVAVVSTTARRTPWMWLAIAAVFAPRLILDWHHNEDHVYLAVYWCTALGLSRWGSHSDKVMACNARLLIGLAFAFATFWKVSSCSFYDGSLCTYKLLYDYRFREVITQPICGLNEAQIDANQTAIVSLTRTGSPLTEVTLDYPDRVVWAGRLLAWWTILIEGSLAVAFLTPPRWIRSTFRHGILLLFTATTYLIVPVLGFGLLFMTMGIAQTHSDESRVRLAYLATSWLLLLRFAIMS